MCLEMAEFAENVEMFVRLRILIYVAAQSIPHFLQTQPFVDVGMHHVIKNADMRNRTNDWTFFLLIEFHHKRYQIAILPGLGFLAVASQCRIYYGA